MVAQEEPGRPTIGWPCLQPLALYKVDSVRSKRPTEIVPYQFPLVGHTFLYYDIQPSLRPVVVTSSPVQMGVSWDFLPAITATVCCLQSPVSDEIWPWHLQD